MNHAIVRVIRVVQLNQSHLIASATDRIAVSVMTFLISPSHALCEVISFLLITYCFATPLTISTIMRIHSIVNGSFGTHTYSKNDRTEEKMLNFINAADGTVSSFIQCFIIK